MARIPIGILMNTVLRRKSTEETPPFDYTIWLSGHDPADGTIPDPDTAIVDIIDKSGGLRKYTQASGTSQGLYKEEVVDELGSILLDGTNDYYQRAWDAIIAGTEMTLFIVMTSTQHITTVQTFFMNRYAPSPFNILKGISLYKAASNDATVPNRINGLFGSADGQPWNSINGSKVVSLTVPTLLTLRATGGKITLYQDGACLGTTGYYPVSEAQAAESRIGAGNTGGVAQLLFKGYFHEAVVCDEALSDADLDEGITYFTDAWGITRANWGDWSGLVDSAELIFRQSLIANTDIVALDENTVIASWGDAGVATYGFVCAGTLAANNTTISWGTPVAYSNSSTVTTQKIVKLSATEAVVLFRDTGDSSKLKANYMSVSGNTISLDESNILTIETDGIDSIGGNNISDTQILAVYSGSTPGGKAVVLTVAAGIITAGTKFSITGGQCVDIKSSKISSTQALIVYSDSADSSYGKAKVLNISGTTITGGTSYKINGNVVASLFRVCTISSTLFAVAYKNFGDSQYSNVILLSVADTVITSGSPARIINLIPTDGHFDICKGDDDHVFISFRNVTDTRLRSVVGTITDTTTVTLGTSVERNPAQSSSLAVAQLDNFRTITVFRDHGDSNKGHSIVHRAV